MSKTVVGVFKDYALAEKVARDLEKQGYTHADISVVANDQKGEYSNMGTGEAASGAGTGAAIGGVAGLALGLVALAIPGIGPIIALGPLAAALTGAGIGAAAGGLIGGMTSLGVPEEDAHHYSERVKGGEALVLVNTPDNRAETAVSLLESYGAENVDQRPGETSNSSSTTTAPVHAASGKTAARGSGAIPVVEEELLVGKREVSRGGIRVYSHITEKPVSEQIELREEHVNVTRTPVDRPASSADFAAFREGTVEMRETAEEAVVNKRARVVEEVTLGKESTSHVETVRDTVRRTNVEVEDLGANEFESHYRTNYASSGEPFDSYAPGYAYGSELGSNPQYKGKNWSDVETSARSGWESRGGQGSWDKLKNSIRHGWDKATAKV